MGLRYPNEDLPEVQMSLREFVDKASHILHDSNDIFDFCRMVLAGRLDVEGVEHRLFINARQSLQQIRPSRLTITRDYDSISACTHNLPFKVPFSVYPVAPFKETLTQDNHLTGKAFDKQGRAIWVPLYQIPNLPLGKASIRHVTRMVFPRLYEEGSRDRSINAHALTQIYDKGIRPAVEAVNETRLSHWPASYAAALSNAKDTNGRLHFGTRDLPADVMADFSIHLKQNLSHLPKFKDMYFMHEVRGTKGFTVHDPEDAQERWTALENELDFLDFENMTLPSWYIDVGLEVYLPHHVLQWLEDAHLRLLEFGLPLQAELRPDSLSELRGEKKNFLNDRVAQLKEFAGFRCTPGTRGKDDGVAYLNVYTTDKEPTYQLHKGNFRRHNASDLLPFSGGKKILNEVAEMCKVFGQCMGNDERTPNEGCARFEIRVTLSETPDALSTISNDLLRNSLVAIPAALWWEFKFIRAAALRYVFEDKLRAAAETRTLRSSLVLGAVSVWMLNALNFRPLGTTLGDLLSDACCQHTGLSVDVDPEDDSFHEDEESTFPMGYNRGLYFLADIVEDTKNELWRVPMAVADKIEKLHLMGMYGRTSMEALEHDAGIDRVLAPKGTLTHDSRIPNKRKKTTDVQFARGPEIEEDNIELQLAERGVTIRPLAREAGRDVDEHQARSYPEPDQPEIVGADEAVASIWKQAAYDIFAVAPNGARSRDPSHIILSKRARNEVTWETFKSTNFSEIFEKVQIRMVSKDFWERTLFDRYFPPKGTPPKERGKLQNFPYTTYYPQWFKLMTQLSDGDAKIVRAGLLTEFRKVKWLPHGGSDRMWDTGRMTSNNWKIYPIGSKLVACPQIAVNTDIWNMEPITMGIRAEAMEEDEAEE